MRSIVVIKVFFTLLGLLFMAGNPAQAASPAPSPSPAHPASKRGSTWSEDTVPAEVRDQSFARAGLESFVSGWDELDRDRLWVHARKDSFKELAARYPGIPKDKLKLLQQQAR